MLGIQQQHTGGRLQSVYYRIPAVLGARVLGSLLRGLQRQAAQVRAQPSQARAVFGPIFQSALRMGKTIFFLIFFIGASATKRFERSKSFRYGLP